MGFLEKLRAGSKSGDAYNQAVRIFGSLRQYPEHSAQYRKALVGILGLCQQAIGMDGRNGDAHVMLANAYYLFHIEVYPTTGNELALELAAAVISHWFAEPMSQYPWTKNVDNGRRVREMVAADLMVAKSMDANSASIEMEHLEAAKYRQALTTTPSDWANV